MSDPSDVSLLTKFRKSPMLVIFVTFVAMMLHTLIDSTLVPILPDILRSFEETQNNQTAIDGNISTFTKHEKAPIIQHKRIAQSIGLIVAARPATEVVANIVSGCIVDKFGHYLPMTLGFVFNTIAVIGFAFVPNILWMVLLRVVEAIGSSLSVVSCMALVAETFQEDHARNKALGISYVGYAVGLVIGYPFGPCFYHFFGVIGPFATLAVITVLDGVLRLLVIPPTDRKALQATRPNPIHFYIKLIRDPFIVMALLCTFAVYNGIGVFMALATAWMTATLGAQLWQISAVMLVAMTFMVIGQVLASILLSHDRRWYFLWAGMIFNAIGMITYPCAINVWYIIAPESACRLGIGLAVCCVSTLIGYISDLRHDGAYGAAFGLYNSVNDFAFVVGPIVSGFLVNVIGFRWLYTSQAIFLFLASFCCLAFRKIPSREDVKTDQTVENIHDKIEHTNVSDYKTFENDNE